MEHFASKLLGQRKEARDTFSFIFERPQGFEYTAGQFVGVLLSSLEDVSLKEKLRSMSLSSAPSDKDLEITVRVSKSLFKQTLLHAPTGFPITLQGPFGKFILPEQHERSFVFLAGGIGVVPFRSMIRHLVFQSWPKRVFLFYSNRYLEDAAFFEEFASISTPQFTFIPTFTNSERVPKPWMGEFGHITINMIEKYLSFSGISLITHTEKSPYYYVVGVPDMVSDLRMKLLEFGVPESELKVEYFTGYK